MLFLILPFVKGQQENLLKAGLEEVISPNQVGSGARSLSLGNAFIAIADDATAASWNPAGLTQLQSLEISFAVEGVYQRSSTKFSGDKSNDLEFSEFNYVSVVIPFAISKKKQALLSLNYLTLFQFEKNLQLPFSGDDSGLVEKGVYMMDQKGTFAVLSPAFAIEISQRLSLGVTLNVWGDDWTQNSSFTKEESNSGETTFGPASIEFLFEDTNEYLVDEGYSWVLGALYRLTKSFTVAAVVKPAFTLELDHFRLFRSSDLVNNNESFFDSSADLDFPWILGAGFAWCPSEPITVSMDVTWTDWSSYKLKENGAKVNPITGREGRLQDAYTVRFGSEYALVGKKTLIPLRVGFGYDPTPAVGDVDDFYTINAGFGFQYGRFMLDFGYEFRWGNNVNGDSLADFNATQDVRRHRLLSSLIVYF